MPSPARMMPALLLASLALPAEAQLTPLVAVSEGHLFDGPAAGGDGAGRSVAVSGDTAALGIPGDDHAGGLDAGAVALFVRAAGSWSQQDRVTLPGGATGDGFGAAVALFGETLAVGIPKAHGGAGAVAVFVRSGTSWVHQQTLRVAGGSAGDSLGAAVAVDGDTLAAGAPGADGAGSDRGALHVWLRTGSTWSPQQSLTASDAADLDLFGQDVALQGDTLVCGAPGRDAPGADQSGGAYVFTRGGAVWSEQDLLLPSSPQTEGRCGEAVALSGETALLGAAGETGPFAGIVGAAYVFVRDGASWSAQARLVSGHPLTGPRFGSDVALVEDLAVVVAGGLSDQGLAFGYTRAGSFWSQVLLFDDPAPAPGDDEGGTYAAFDGDLVLLSQPADDHGGGVDAGSARVWRITRGPWDDLGGGCAGSFGVPILAAGGLLADSSQVDFALVSAAPSAPAWFVFSLASVDVPFWCCTLGPDPTPPFGGFVTRTTTPSGDDAISALFPPGVPPGLTIDFQYVVADDAQGCAVALSNVLRGTTF